MIDLGQGRKDYPTLEEGVSTGIPVGRSAMSISIVEPRRRRGRRVLPDSRDSDRMDVQNVGRKTPAGIEVDLTVSPRSSKSGIGEIDPWRKRLIVRVKAPPLDGRANREVEEVLGETFGCKAQVVSGQTSRQKTVLLVGDQEGIWARMKDLRRTIPSVSRRFLRFSGDCPNWPADM